MSFFSLGEREVFLNSDLKHAYPPPPRPLSLSAKCLKMDPGVAKLCRAKFAFCIFSKTLTIYSRNKHTNKKKNKVKKIKFSKI